MKTVYLLLFFLICSFSSHATIQSDPYAKLSYLKLANGMQVYLLPNANAKNTKILAEFNVGWDNEDEKTYGLSHLVEHLVFRDRRVPKNDYLDYIQDEGGIDVNGFTRQYTTGYTATIDSNKSYWLAETFAQMLFDKNVTYEDLEIERRALQTEVGDTAWYDKPFDRIGAFFSFLNTLSPPEDNIYLNDFAMEKPKEAPSRYLRKHNNKAFSFEEVMAHYRDYYYPANLTLKIVGNFDLSHMQTLINAHYASLETRSGKSTLRPKNDATLNNAPYKRIRVTGNKKATAYMGAKYLRNDFKEYLITDAYMSNFATRMQALLRNELGQTYSVYNSSTGQKNAALALIQFDSLNEEMQNNLALITEQLHKDRSAIDDATIDAALEESKKDYLTTEYDTNSLMWLVNGMEYMKNEFNIHDTTPYALFTSITHDEFREHIRTLLSEEHRYEFIVWDYALFPFDIFIISLLFYLVTIYIYVKFSQIQLKARGLFYTKREIVFSRRLSNVFISIVVVFTLFIVAVILSEWLKYFLLALLTGEPYFDTTLPLSYTTIASLIDFLLFLAIYVLVFRVLFSWYYARVDLTKERINILGAKLKIIDKKSIEAIEVAPWSITKTLRIYGTSLLFFKALVAIKTKEGETVYLRSSNAGHLREDLIRWWEES